MLKRVGFWCSQNVIAISRANGAFVVLKKDGSVVTRGSADSGGDSTAVTSQLANIKKVYNNERAFAALNTTGGVVAWDTQHLAVGTTATSPRCTRA